MSRLGRRASPAPWIEQVIDLPGRQGKPLPLWTGWDTGPSAIGDNRSKPHARLERRALNDRRLASDGGLATRRRDRVMTRVVTAGSGIETREPQLPERFQMTGRQAPTKKTTRENQPDAD